MSVFEWFRENKLESFRRMVVWGALLGVLLYIYGEIGGSESILIAGIWILVGSIGAALLFKVVSFVYGFFSK